MQLDGQTDEHLVRLVADGNDKAFTILMRRHKDAIVNFAYRFLGNHEDAVDVAQETFVRLYKHAGTFSGDVKFTTWLYTIAGNLSKSELKRYRRRMGVSLGEAFGRGDDDASWDVPDASSYTPDVRVDSTTIAQAVQKALMSISPTYREMVILRDIQEMSYEEIAAVTSTELGTVKSRINRGRQQLQELLKGLHQELK
jgi:RNA polymerase sigma-70 factor (ECF subfamily)